MPSGKPPVSNASSLIWLCKVGRLALLKGIFGRVVIPKKVYLEVTSGEQADSIPINRAIEEGWMEIHECEIEGASVLRERAGIHEGEAEAILLAQRLGAEVIIDEREGSATAQIFGVRPIGTMAILLLALAKGDFSFEDFRECLDRLTSLGFWLSLDVYSRVLEEARLIVERRRTIGK